jgi:hypothetical protein
MAWHLWHDCHTALFEEIHSRCAVTWGRSPSGLQRFHHHVHHLAAFGRGPIANKLGNRHAAALLRSAMSSAILLGEPPASATTWTSKRSRTKLSTGKTVHMSLVTPAIIFLPPGRPDGDEGRSLRAFRTRGSERSSCDWITVV